MRWPLVLVVGVALAIAGCGGGHDQSTPDAPPPVAKQLRESLENALHEPPTVGVIAPSEPGQPHVRSCTGPRAGGAGVYHCTLAPVGGVGPVPISVGVSADGSWTAQVPHNARERRAASEMAWGFGLKLPTR